MIDHLILHGVPNGTGERAPLGMALLYETRLDRYRLFGPPDMDQLRQRLLVCDHLTGYDLVGNELPRLFGKPPPELRMAPEARPMLARTADLIGRVSAAIGRTSRDGVAKLWTLDAVARKTLDRCRIGSDPWDAAATHISRGEWSSAASYALDDIALVRELCGFAERFGYLIGPTGVKLTIRAIGSESPLKTTNPLEAAESSLSSGTGVPGAPLTQNPAALDEWLRGLDELERKAKEVTGG